MRYDKNGIFTGEADDGVYLEHYGTPRHSGRYPWGSGDNPYQRNMDFLASIKRMQDMKDENGKRLYSDAQIAKAMHLKNSGELRARKALYLEQNRAYLKAEAQKLKDKGMSNVAIGERLGKSESSIRDLLNENKAVKMSMGAKNAELLKKRLDEVDYIQVGAGTEYYLNNVTSTSLNNTLYRLKQEGYTVTNVQVEQQGTGKMTTVKVLAKPGVTWKEINANKGKIQMPVDIYQENEQLREVEPYQSVDPKRVSIRYAEDGGTDRDGVIELRRGVPDLDLGKNHYAQVRIKVGEDRYLKGMAMYADDLPDGVDIRFNTNKTKDKSFEEVLKKTKGEDLENPFGANLKPEEKLTRCQRHYIGEDGKEHLSAINIVKEEGDVNDWNRNLASQFLSKQPVEMAKHQLKAKYDIAKSEFDEISSYTNPTVKAKMLEDFAGQCDSDAVHLQAAALPRQANKFILPLPEIGEKEIYAPGYRNGEKVALVRYPHGSVTEIPVLTVNNNNKHADSVIGKDAIDAVGIHPKAAERLSGADFDGDTCVVLPMDRVEIKSKDQYPELIGFDPKTAYKGYPGMHVMTSSEKGREMGMTTNLITDMTIQGASPKELARAIKHSMVVIDAEKHELDYKRSEQENGIPELKAKYQPNGGASTLLSRSTSPLRIAEREEKRFSQMTPDEKKRYLDGEMIYKDTGKFYTKTTFPRSKMTKEEKAKWDTGDPELQKEVRAAFYATDRQVTKEHGRMMEIRKGAYYNPYELASTGNKETTTPIERAYAEHALSMKALAKEARKLARAQQDLEAIPEMKKKYAPEVASLKAKLAIAEKNAPLEKQAQMLAGERMRVILAEHPELWDDKEHLKRERGRQLDRARKTFGAKKLTIGSEDNPLTDKEWEAIQNHAVTKTMLRKIIDNTDAKRIRELAMPKTQTGIAPAKLSLAKRMMNNGYTQAEICDALDIGLQTLIKAIR